MVGVAGKSKACLNCKKRRVKCGMESPECLRCRKASLLCEGYDRNRVIFVNRTPKDPSTTAGDVLAALHISAPSHDVIDVVEEHRSMLRMSRSSSYSSTDFRNRAYRISRELYLPRKKFVDSSMGAGSPSWVESACRIEYESSALDLSLMAFCAAQLYVTRKGGIGLGDALGAYSNGLSKLSTALRNINTHNLVSVLASIVVLSTCELFICPSDTGWRAHVQGITEVLRLYKEHPYHPHDSQDWLRLCSRSRMITVLTELMTRRKGIMPPNQWRGIFADNTEYDSLDEVLSIAHDLPTIFEWKDAHHKSLIAMATAIKLLYNCEKSFRRRSSKSLFILAPSRMHNPADVNYGNKLNEDVLELQSLPVARCLLIFWSVTVETFDLILHRCSTDQAFNQAFEQLAEIWDFLDPGTIESKPPRDIIAQEADRHAQLICQSVEYMYDIEMGLMGPQCMIYAKWAATEHYWQSEMARDLAWCRNISNMTGPGAFSNIRMMDFQG